MLNLYRQGQCNERQVLRNGEWLRPYREIDLLAAMTLTQQVRAQKL